MGNFFGKSPVQNKPQTLIKQSTSEPDKPKEVNISKEKGSRSKKKRKAEKELTLEDHFNDDFEATLLLLDEEKLGITPKKANGKDTQHKKKSVVETDDDDQIECTPKELVENEQLKSKSSRKDGGKKENVNMETKRTPEKKELAASSTTPSERSHCGSSSKKKSKQDLTIKKTAEKADPDLNESTSERLPCDSDHKRKANAEAYQRFLQRGGPKNPGSKPIPVVRKNHFSFSINFLLSRYV